MKSFLDWLAAPWVLVWSQRTLLLAITQRDLAARYRGSIFGILWSLITPLVMLLVFTFVFTQVFNSRWPLDSGKSSFAMILFCGLLLFQFFSECLTRSPAIISDNASLVKKVVFPVEILPSMVVLSALANSGISFIILLAGYMVLQGVPPVTILLIPLIVLPFIAFVMGMSWFLACLGVFVRDVGQAMAIISTMLMFLSGVFFPPQSLPEHLRIFVYVSPVTLPIEQVRSLLFEAAIPHWGPWALYALIAFLVAALGLSFFKKLRGGFADVV